MSIDGTAGDDHLVGTGSDDIFDASQGGQDWTEGLGGNDTFMFGAAFDKNDVIDGGDGFNNVLQIDGDYSAGLTLKGSTIAKIQTIEMAAGNTYNLTTSDGNVGASETVTIDGSAIDSAHRLIFNGSAETNGRFAIIGGHGNDILTSGNNSSATDSFDLSQGGADNAKGGAGYDYFYMHGALDRNDRLDGGADTDTVILEGDYSAGLKFKASTFTSIEGYSLQGDHSYKLTFIDANFSFSGLSSVSAYDVAAGNTVRVDCSAVVSNRVQFLGGPNDDVFLGSAGDDNISSGLGTELFKGLNGNDFFNFAQDGVLDSHDRIDGGIGTDTLFLGSGLAGGITLNANISNIEVFVLNSGANYKVTTKDAVVAVGQTLTINATDLGGGNHVTFKGAAETDGRFNFGGGGGDDVVIGGAGDDVFTGNGGADDLTGNGGADQFNFVFAVDSSGPTYDTIHGFDANEDLFDIPVVFAGLNATVASGALSTATFDADLAAAVGAGELGKLHALAFTPDSGTLAGHTFLIVDCNNAKGYQTGVDLVVELISPLHMGSLGDANFV